jgi:disease resistance protein RPS2
LIEVVNSDDVGRILCVKMHDVLRDLAIRIAEKEHRCYLKAGQGVSLFPVEEVDGKACERMSLVYNHLESLPTTFACSSLSVLLLRENPGIKEVPGTFLRELSSLKVLDLSRTGIKSLPPSIGNLKHLASLQLAQTGIRELPETIGDLKELQFLNVSRCDQIGFLPERISELKHLRTLDISGCFQLSYLPRGISELVSLERLQGNITLDFEEDSNAERKYACLKDLQSLRRLRIFGVEIKSPVKEGVIGKWSKMRDLWLGFKDVNQDYLPQDMRALKDLEGFHLVGCDVQRLPSWISEFRKLACLQIWYCNQLKELPPELGALPCLKMLEITGCDKLEELELGKGFPKLEELSLGDLDSLERIGAVAVAAASGSGGLGQRASPLPMLKSLFVEGCWNLKTLRGDWDKLKSLQEIRGEREWWDAIQWEDLYIKMSLESKYRSRNLFTV